MTLQDIESGGRAVPLSLIGADRALATHVQERLGAVAAAALLADAGEPLFPLRTPDSLAGRIVRSMQAAGTGSAAIRTASTSCTWRAWTPTARRIPTPRTRSTICE